MRETGADDAPVLILPSRVERRLNAVDETPRFTGNLRFVYHFVSLPLAQCPLSARV